MPDKKLSREEKLIVIYKRLRRNHWWHMAVAFDFKTEHEVLENVLHISLSKVLEYIRKKFKLKTLTPHITRTVAMWRFNHDDLRLQWNYCIDWVYYLVTVRLPKKPKNHEHNTNQKDGVQRGNKEVHNGD